MKTFAIDIKASEKKAFKAAKAYLRNNGFVVVSKKWDSCPDKLFLSNAHFDAKIPKTTFAYYQYNEAEETVVLDVDIESKFKKLI